MSKLWKTKKLGNVCHKITDGTHKTPIYQDAGIVFLSARNIKNGRLSFANHKYISEKEHLELTKRCKPETDDVMLSKSGSLGDAITVPELPFSFSIFESLALIKPQKEVLSPEYLQQYLNSPHSKRYFWSITSGIAVKHLHLVDLRKMPIHIPPMDTQNNITNILKIWDNAIEKTETLIAVKEKQFEWLAQQVFKPAEAWKTYKLSDLFENRRETKNTDLPLISITREKGVIPHSETNRKDNSNKDKSKYLRIRPNDIGYNTMRMWQGVSALSKIDGIVSPAYTICIPNENIDPEFMAFMFKTKAMIHKFYRYSQGLTSDTWNLKFHHFSEVKASIPDLQSQIEIAKVLNTAKKEINALKQTANKYRTQKRGLMQKLLTGEWQVKTRPKSAEKTIREVVA